MRKDFELEGLEVLELMCDLLHERSGVLSQSKVVPAELAECVQTLLWCAPRLAQEVPEMRTVHEQLCKKYTTAYAKATERFAAAASAGSAPPVLPDDVPPVLSNFACCVNARVLRVLSFSAPATEKVKEYLSAISLEFGVELDEGRLAAAVQDNPLGSFSSLHSGNDTAGGSVPTPIDPSTTISASAPIEQEEPHSGVAAASGFASRSHSASSSDVPIAHPVQADRAYTHGFSAGYAAAMSAAEAASLPKGSPNSGAAGGGQSSSAQLHEMQAAHLAAAAATPGTLPTGTAGSGAWASAATAPASSAPPSHADLAARFARLKQG